MSPAYLGERDDEQSQPSSHLPSGSEWTRGRFAPSDRTIKTLQDVWKRRAGAW